MTVEINGVILTPKTRFKVKEVRAIDALLVTNTGSDEDTKKLLESLCDIEGDFSSVVIEDMFEDDIYAILKTYTDYKKKLIAGLDINSQK